jgi:hypothetical protein
METKIFGRLSAWKNWIFNGPNASGLESNQLSLTTSSNAWAHLPIDS